MTHILMTCPHQHEGPADREACREFFVRMRAQADEALRETQREAWEDGYGKGASAVHNGETANPYEKSSG